MTTMLSTAFAPATALFQGWRGLFAADRSRPAPRSTAEEAAAVRALADSYRRTDPGFASDLYAAVDRYESACEAAAGR